MKTKSTGKSTISIISYGSYHEFLNHFPNANLAVEQAKAIEILIDGGQFEFSMEDWQDLYDGLCSFGIKTVG